MPQKTASELASLRSGAPIICVSIGRTLINQCTTFPHGGASVSKLVDDRFGDRIGELGLHRGLGELAALDRVIDETDLDQDGGHRGAE